MRIGHWLAVAGVLYFVVTGINEAIQTDNTTINMLPDFGLMTGAQPGVANYAGAGLDFAAAAGIYFAVLHKKLF